MRKTDIDLLDNWVWHRGPLLSSPPASSATSPVSSATSRVSFATPPASSATSSTSYGDTAIEPAYSGQESENENGNSTDSARAQHDRRFDEDYTQGLPADASFTVAPNPLLTFHYWASSSDYLSEASNNCLSTVSSSPVDREGNITPWLNSYSVQYNSGVSFDPLAISEHSDFSANEPNEKFRCPPNQAMDDEGYNSFEPDSASGVNPVQRSFYIDIWLLAQHAERVIEMIQAGQTIHLVTPYAGNGSLRIGVAPTTTETTETEANKHFNFVLLSSGVEGNEVRLERDPHGQLVSATFSFSDNQGGIQTDAPNFVEVHILANSVDDDDFRSGDDEDPRSGDDEDSRSGDDEDSRSGDDDGFRSSDDDNFRLPPKTPQYEPELHSPAPLLYHDNTPGAMESDNDQPYECPPTPGAMESDNDQPDAMESDNDQPDAMESDNDQPRATESDSDQPCECPPTPGATESDSDQPCECPPTPGGEPIRNETFYPVLYPD